MGKLSSKISLPIILAGIFSITIFIALDYERLEANLLFYLVLILLTLFTFFFGFSTGQTVTSPIKKLLDKANALKNGNLDSRLYLETKDEISELAKVFNQIADELEYSKSNEQKTEKSVDIKVRARTKALEDTINNLEQKVKNRTIELQKIVADLEKFQTQSKAREDEAIELKRQIRELKTEMGEHEKGKKNKEE